MGYHLVPLVHAGTRAGRPVRRPLGYDAGVESFVTLDPGDKSQPTSGVCLAYSGVDLSDARAEKIATGKDEGLAVAARAKLAAKLGGREFKGGPCNQQIADYLKTIGLRPSVNRRRFEVWLGPKGGDREFYVERVAPTKHSKAWADTFTRSDGSLDGSTLSGGGTTWNADLGDVVSNQLVLAPPASDTNYFFLVATDGDTDSLYARIDNIASDSDGDNMFGGLVVAANAAATSGYVGYAKWHDPSATGEHGIFRLSDSAWLDGDEDTIADHLSSGTLRLLRDGSSVELLHNGTTLAGPLTDTTETAGAGFRLVGGWALSESIAPSWTVDNFLGGDLVVTLAITGTATESIDEADIVAGGKTIILTLTGGQFVP